jgi:anti-sigma factor RsiW
MAEKKKTEKHPADETLARYAKGEISREEGRKLEQHLMACIDCQRKVDALPGAGRGVKWRGHRFRPDPEKEQEMLERAEADRQQRENLRGVLQSLGNIMGSLGDKELSQLLDESEVGRRKLIQKDSRYHSIHLCELLLGRCRAAWIDDPGAAVEFAKLAALIAEKLDPEMYGSRSVRNLKAMVWKHLGNSFRVASAAGLAVPMHVMEMDEDEPETAPEVADDEYPYIVIPSLAVAETPHLTEAEGALFEIRDAFLERGMGFDAALVTLELATLYLRQGHGGFLHTLATEALPHFEAAETRGVLSYTTDSIRFLRDNAAAGKVTPETLDRMCHLLQRRRNDPELRFREKNV